MGISHFLVQAFTALSGFFRLHRHLCRLISHAGHQALSTRILRRFQLDLLFQVFIISVRTRKLLLEVFQASSTG